MFKCRGAYSLLLYRHVRVDGAYCLLLYLHVQVSRGILFLLYRHVKGSRVILFVALPSCASVEGHTAFSFTVMLKGRGAYGFSLYRHVQVRGAFFSFTVMFKARGAYC